MMKKFMSFCLKRFSFKQSTILRNDDDDTDDVTPHKQHTTPILLLTGEIDEELKASKFDLKKQQHFYYILRPYYYYTLQPFICITMYV